MWNWEWCPVCEVEVPAVDEFDDQEGFEEQARNVHVILLDCGHQIVSYPYRRVE